MASERTLKIGAYATLYLVWGSTYLAMHIALETLPPYILASARFLVAAAVLIAIARLRGSPWPRPREWGRSAAVALFLLVGGNTAVLYALKTVPSGVAALLVSTTPLFIAILTRSINVPSAIGIALGLCGVGILVGPQGFAGAERTNPVGAAVLVAASLSWAIGSLIQRNGKLDALMATGTQMLCGGAMIFVLAVFAGQLHPAEILEHASARSALAVLYLTVFGSLLGFTAYGWLLAHDEPARVATYAYVNPIVAVVLGALLAHESVSPRIVVAAAVIITGVAVIVTRRR